MINSFVCGPTSVIIVKSSQQALQAAGTTRLAVAGETRLILFRADRQLALDALVLDDLEVDVLAGIPFLTARTSPSVLQCAKYVFRTLKSNTTTPMVSQLVLMLSDVYKVTSFLLPLPQRLFGPVNIDAELFFCQVSLVSVEK